MIPKADRDADAAILAAATRGTWITVLPSSQEGGVQLAGFGPSQTPIRSTAVSLRVGGTDSNTAKRAGDVAFDAAMMTMEQHAANAKAAAHAVNRLPEYIADAAEMETALAALVATIPRCDGGLGADDALPCCKPGHRQPAMWGNGQSWPLVAEFLGTDDLEARCKGPKLPAKAGIGEPAHCDRRNASTPPTANFDHYPMWGGGGELMWCDGHHAAGYGEEQLPHAAMTRAAIAILRGGQ